MFTHCAFLQSVLLQSYYEKHISPRPSIHSSSYNPCVCTHTPDRLHHRNPSSLRQIEISSLVISLPCQPRARTTVSSIASSASASAAAAEANRRCWRWLSRVLSNLKNLHRCAALLALYRTLSSFAHLIFIPLERGEGDCINRCASSESSSKNRTVFQEAD